MWSLALVALVLGWQKIGCLVQHCASTPRRRIRPRRSARIVIFGAVGFPNLSVGLASLSIPVASSNTGLVPHCRGRSQPRELLFSHLGRIGGSFTVVWHWLLLGFGFPTSHHVGHPHRRPVGLRRHGFTHLAVGLALSSSWSKGTGGRVKVGDGSVSIVSVRFWHGIG